jgi:small subunit ribosomal protein S17
MADEVENTEAEAAVDAPAEPAAEEAAVEQDAPPAAPEPTAEAKPAPKKRAPAKKPAAKKAEAAPAARTPRKKPAAAKATPVKKERGVYRREPKPEREAGRRKERRGVVVADAGDKSITVRVDSAKPHPKYKKIVRRSTRLHAHDAENKAKVGDIVRIVETRPLSKLKRWRLVEILEAAK